MAEEVRRKRRRSLSRSASRGSWLPAVGGRAASRAAKAILGVAAALGLVWLIVGHFGADEVGNDPATATWFTDGISSELRAANAALAATPPDVAAARRIATEALAESPLNVRPLSVLARAATADQDAAKEAEFRDLIAERTLRDFPTMLWQFEQQANRQDYPAMMETADAILRQNMAAPGALYVMDRMTVLMADEKARGPMAEKLSTPSTWRRTFLDTAARKGDINAFPELMSLIQPDNPIRVGISWNVYFKRLIPNGASRMAYAVWVGLIDLDPTGALGLIYNGGFEQDATGLPFDWTITPARGMEIVRDEDIHAEGTSSLRVTFGGGETNFNNVQQTLILDPGRYRFSGQVRMDDLRNARGMRLALHCLGPDSAVIAQSPLFSGTSDWKRFSVDFEVPPQFCDYQTLRFELPARSNIEKRIEGSIWLDDLDIVPAPPTDAAAGQSAGG
jgi:hypothetical protein